MPNVELLEEFKGKLDDEAWRKLTAALECETKIFSLRTDALQLSLDQMLQGIKPEKPAKSIIHLPRKEAG